MYKNISFQDFRDEFAVMDRKDNFTYDGLKALFEYLEEIEEDTCEPIELDVIALCCEFNEDPLEEVLKNYELESLEHLQDETRVINFDEKTGLVLYEIF